MTVASGRRPDASRLVPQQQGGSLELRAHGRRPPAARGSRLDLTDGPGEHRDDIAAVADASLLRRGATASARLALAWSNHTSPLECRETVATPAGRTIPPPGRGTSRAQGLALLTPGLLAALPRSTTAGLAPPLHAPSTLPTCA